MSSNWWNRGLLVSHLALGDRGFSFGHRVMTTMLAEGGLVYDLDRHIERLLDHAERAGLPIDFDTPQLRAEILAAVAMNSGHAVACRVYITAGEGSLKQPIQKVERWIHTEVLSHDRLQPSSQKLDLLTDNQWKKGDQIKTGLYGSQMAALHKSIAKGKSDILWCNGDQEITECTTANIFLIGREGDLVEIATPASASGILCGITRRRIAELLNTAKIPVTERIIYREEIPRFDEAFVTSSLAGVVPVAEIGSHKLHSERPTSVVHHVLRLWNAWKKTQGMSESEVSAPRLNS